MTNRLKSLAPWLICCVPGVAVAIAVGLSLTLALPTFALTAGNPVLYGLVAMALLCPLTKVVGVLFLRRSATHCALAPQATAQQLAVLRREAETLQHRITQLHSR